MLKTPSSDSQFVFYGIWREVLFHFKLWPCQIVGEDSASPSLCAEPGTEFMWAQMLTGGSRIPLVLVLEYVTPCFVVNFWSLEKMWVFECIGKTLNPPAVYLVVYYRYSLVKIKCSAGLVFAALLWVKSWLWNVSVWQKQSCCSFVAAKFQYITTDSFPKKPRKQQKWFFFLFLNFCS